MIQKIKSIYNKLIKTKLANQIILIISIICIIQMITSLIMYGYFYNIRKEEVIENNMQILQQANSNYLSIIIEDLYTASEEIFYNEVFWDKGYYENASEDNRIYSVLANKYHSIGNIDSIYLFSSKSNKFYIMDEISFRGIPIKILGNNSFLTGYDDMQSLPWYVESLKRDGSVAITRGKEIREGERDIISFSRYIKYPLKNQDNYFVVTINMNRARLDELHKQLGAEEEALVIFDENDYCIYGDENDAANEIIKKEIKEEIKDEEGGSSKWFPLEINNHSYIVISNTSQIKKWTMVKIIPKESIMGSVMAQFIGNCIMILVIFILGILILYYIINKTTKPIEKLAKIMRYYHQGIEYKDPLIAQRMDEVGVLYTSFEKMNQRIDRLIELEYQSQIQEKQARLEALQAQLDPHFLYNTLQTISGIAIEKNVFEIEHINNSLSNILRYSLNKDKTVVTVAEELNNVKNYMEIQKYRYGERINLIVELSEDVMECKIPVFALQLAVENSIKHGSEKKIGVENIVIYDKIEYDSRLLMIRDNGSGIEEKRLLEIRNILEKGKKENGKGYDQKGLINLNERLKQHFGSGYGIEIANNDDEGAIVIIRIPF